MEQGRQHVTVKMATVLVLNADGTYKVLPDSGRGVGLPIDGVRAKGETDYEAGDRVALVWERAGEGPWILLAGVGSVSGGACTDCLSDTGTLSEM